MLPVMAHTFAHKIFDFVSESHSGATFASQNCRNEVPVTPKGFTATGEQKAGYDSAARKYPQATSLKLFSNLCQNVPAKNLLLVLTLGAPVILPIALLSLSGLLALSLRSLSLTKSSIL